MTKNRTLGITEDIPVPVVLNVKYIRNRKAWEG